MGLALYLASLFSSVEEERLRELLSKIRHRPSDVT